MNIQSCSAVQNPLYYNYYSSLNHLLCYILQSGGLDGSNSRYNPASMGSIPLHSLSHILQEQMNGVLANGSGYQSDSSATQSPPQAL